MQKKADILFDYIPVLFAFLMPFGLNLSALVVFWFVTSLFKIDKVYFVERLKCKWFLVFIVFFGFYIISALLSGNANGGLNAIELKLGFLGFPYFFFLFRINKTTVMKIITAFVSGCFIALIACLIRAGWLFISDGENYFYYTRFSYFLHAGYFSMYLCFALIVVFILYPRWFNSDKLINAVRYFLITMFIIGIFLCASKIGIITFLITVMLVPLFVYKQILSLKGIVFGILGLFTLAFLLYIALPTPFSRLSSAFSSVTSGNIDKTSSESTVVRMLIWSESIEIIKQDFWTGVGAGDVNDVLHERYKQQGLTGALEHNLNAHNQYFQTFIALGVFGFLILMALTFGAMVYGYVERNLILVLFSVSIILNFLVESMLQTQAGNMFYCFFLCLLLTTNLLNSTEADTKKLHKTA